MQVLLGGEICASSHSRDTVIGTFTTQFRRSHQMVGAEGWELGTIYKSLRIVLAVTLAPIRVDFVPAHARAVVTILVCAAQSENVCRLR